MSTYLIGWPNGDTHRIECSDAMASMIKEAAQYLTANDMRGIREVVYDPSIDSAQTDGSGRLLVGEAFCEKDAVYQAGWFAHESSHFVDGTDEIGANRARYQVLDAHGINARPGGEDYYSDQW